MILKEQILELEHRLIEGIKSSDVELLDKLLHDDLLFMAPGGQMITKKMDLDSHRSGGMVVHYLLPTFEAISLLDNVAIVTVVYQTKGVMAGTPIEGRFRYIRTWKKTDSGLQIISGACMNVPDHEPVPVYADQGN